MSHCSYRALREVETQPQAVGDLKDERSLESGGEADYPLTEQNPGEVRCRKRTSTRWPSAALALLSLIVLALFGGDDLLSSLGIGGVGTRHGCSKVPSRLKTSTFVPTNYSVVEGIFIQDSRESYSRLHLSPPAVLHFIMTSRRPFTHSRLRWGRV